MKNIFDVINGLDNAAKVPALRAIVHSSMAKCAGASQPAPAQQEWRLVLPGGKYTDDGESARVGDYNRGWNDYRKTAIAALNSVVWPARTSGSWVGASPWLRNNYQDYPDIASLCDAMLEPAPQQEAQEPSHRETVDVVGVRSNGEHVNLEKIAMPPRMKAREIAIEQFGSFKDDDGSDADMCFGALEYFLEWLIQQGWSKAPQPAPAPLSERDAFEAAWKKLHGKRPVLWSRVFAEHKMETPSHSEGKYFARDEQAAWKLWQVRAALAAQGGKT